MSFFPDGFTSTGSSSNNLVTEVTTGVNKAIGSIGQAATDIRKSISGLFGGGLNSPFSGQAAPTPTVKWTNSGTDSMNSGMSDWRVRISLPDNAPFLYRVNSDAGSILNPVWATAGVVFPYTPSIAITHTANYQSQALTHSNYKSFAYESSEVKEIVVSGDFTVQNPVEAKYLLSCLYFLRACTKMFYGQGQFAGNPPPMVYLDGYGKYILPHISCVVTNVTHTMPPDVDYMVDDITADADNQTWVPTNSQISVTLQPVVSRNKIAGGFNLDTFAQGNYLKDTFGGGLL